MLSPQAESWLADLDRAMALSDDEYPPSIRQRLIYLLSITDGVASGPPQPVLELKSVRLLKDDTFSGTVSNYDPQSAFSSTPAKFLRGSDIPILRRLLHLRGLYGYGGGRGHSLSGETGAEALELVLATGRCRWQSLDGPVMTPAEPRRGALGWTMMDNGAQKPIVSVEGGGTAVCLIPPWYVDGEAAACGPLQIDVPPRVAAMLMQAPMVEPQQVAALRGKLADRLPGHSQLLPAEPSPPDVIAGPPTPVLQLARRTLRPTFNGYSWATPSAPQDLQVARVAFAYGPIVLPAHDQRDQSLFARDGRLFAIERDRSRENQHRKQLAAADAKLAAIQAHHAYALPPDARGELILTDDDAMAWPRFLVEVAPRLREEGWRIEIEPGFAPPLAEADGDVDAVLHEGSGIDWFEFDVGISVDGERINLLPQIIDLLKAVPDDADSDFFDLEDGDRQTLFVALDDGRLLPLPYARLQPILAALHELFRVDLNGEKLGFGRGRAAELAALEELIAGAGMAWSGGEALRNSGSGCARRDPSAKTRRKASPRRCGPTRAGCRLAAVPARRGWAGCWRTTWASARRCRPWRTSPIEQAAGRLDRPALIVCPTSLVPNWLREAARFAPALRVLPLHGPDAEGPLRRDRGARPGADHLPAADRGTRRC